MRFRTSWLATTIGSLPHVATAEACDLVLKYTPELPAWPQLPKRSSLENMYAQFMELFPGAEVADGRVVVTLDDGFHQELERLYADYVEKHSTRYLPSSERASGLRALVTMLQEKQEKPHGIKGQLTGPVSLALQVTDQELRPLLYDEVAFDAVARYLSLAARAQEQLLSTVCKDTVIFFDEPYLHAFGSALFALNREQVVTALTEAFCGLSGLKGIHCCGNTDWSVVLSSPLDILSFDAYHFAETVALYPEDVQAFLMNGGILAWGIVPAEEDLLAREDVTSLMDRLSAGIERLVRKGVERNLLEAQSMITPSCGLGSLSIGAAERALELLAQIAVEARKRWSRL